MNQTAQPTALVLTEVIDHTLLITINRPDSANAVNLDVAMGIGVALESAEHDSSIFCVIITGAGRGYFCAGADLKALSRGEDLVPSSPGSPDWGFACYTRHFISKPTIAAVNGVALGGGLEIVLASDIAVAAESAKFGLPEVERGFMAGGGGAFRLGRQIPRKLAMSMLFTGEPISAQKAAQFGLINELVTEERVLAAALTMADRIATNAPLAVQASKRVAYGFEAGAVVNEESLWSLAERERLALLKTADATEGPLAFAEKRRPVWSNR